MGFVVEFVMGLRSRRLRHFEEERVRPSFFGRQGANLWLGPWGERTFCFPSRNRSLSCAQSFRQLVLRHVQNSGSDVLNWCHANFIRNLYKISNRNIRIPVCDLPHEHPISAL